LKVIEEFKDENGMNWYKVRLFDNRECWIAGVVVEEVRQVTKGESVVEKGLPNTGVVSVRSANLRPLPSLQSNPLASVPAGTPLTLLEKAKDGNGMGWLKVRLQNGHECWVAERLVNVRE
jgi:uncharacterized protein YgiM (DUF1202 family)